MRKGIPCHTKVLESYLRGMSFGENDEVIWLDVVPNKCQTQSMYAGCHFIFCFSCFGFPEITNYCISWSPSWLWLPRFCEFGRACVQRTLSGENSPAVTYYGIMRKDQKDLVSVIETEVYQHWDNLESSPPKHRQRAHVDLTVGGLKILSCSASGPGWPEFILSKFIEGSAEHTDLKQMKQIFEAEYPPPGNTAPAASVGGGPARVTGQPDFTIDGGREPLDPERPVDLLTEAPPAVADRRGVPCLKNLVFQPPGSGWRQFLARLRAPP